MAEKTNPVKVPEHPKNEASPKVKTVKDLSTVELQAAGYRLLRLIEQCRGEIQAINQELQERGDK